MSTTATPAQLIAQAQALLTQASALLVPPVIAPTSRYQSRSDRTVLAEPPVLPLAVKGIMFPDPVFQSPVQRVTDQASRSDAPGVSFRTPSDCLSRGWSCDGQYFWLTGVDGTITVWQLNAATMAVTYLGEAPFSAEPAFSDTVPTLLYGCGQAYANHVTIVSYDIVSKVTTVVVDLSTLSTPAPPNTYTGQLMVEAGTLAVIYGGASQDLHYLVLLQSLATGARSISNILTSTGLGWHLHSMALDQSGRYLLLFPSNADLQAKLATSQVYVIDRTAGGAQALTVAAGGHIALGYGAMVNQDVPSGVWDAAQWGLRSLATPNLPMDLISPILTPPRSVTTMGMADHTCWRSGGGTNAMPVISGTYVFGVVAPWRAWDNEIIAIAVDGSGVVNRFCHHQSQTQVDSGAMASQFEYEPRPNVSPDGKWAVFTSNWGKSLGIDPNGGLHRQDVFLVALT